MKSNNSFFDYLKYFYPEVKKERFQDKASW